MRDNLTSNDAGRAGTVPHKDEEFWFSDGSIVLAAHDVHFRVYREILAHHSAVFEDMLTFPQTTAPADDCPIIELSDSPRDWRRVLRVCMGKSLSLKCVHLCDLVLLNAS